MCTIGRPEKGSVVRTHTPERCWRRVASTRPSARSTPTTVGSSTSPTLSGRATASATPGSSKLSCGRRPAAVAELVEWGCPLARTDDGRLDQRFFGAHRWRRTCYAGDWMGRAIITTLAARARELAIPVVEDRSVARLLVADGGCFGAVAFDLHDGSRTAFRAARWSCAAGVTPACGGAAPPGGTRTSGTRSSSASRPGAGSRTWSWSSSTPPAWWHPKSRGHARDRGRPG